MASELKRIPNRNNFSIDSSHFTSVLLMLFVTPIFTETFSSYILYKKDNSYSEESKIVFFLATLIGQVSFPLFSSMNSGSLILPMFELSETFRSIIQKCQTTEYPLKNTLLCLFAAGAICFLISLVIFFTRQGKIFSMIPMNIVDSLMMSSAVGNIIIGFSWFKIEDRPAFSVFLCVVSFLITVIGMSILKKTNNPKLLVIYLILIILGFNCLKFQFDLDTLVKNRIFITAKSDKLNIKLLASAVSKGSFSYNVIFDNIVSILTISISPLISLATSLPFFSKQFEICPNYNREIYSIGITNLFSSMAFSPVYFNCTGSIMLRICGAETRIHSMTAGVSIVFLYFIHHLIAPFLPRFAVSFISQFIGFSVLLGYIKTLPELTRIDKAVLLLTVLVAVFTKMNTIIVLCFGVFLSTAISLYFTRRCLSGSESVILDEKGTVKVKEVLDYRNIQYLVDCFKNDKIILDLTDVKYVDYTANSKLEQLFKDLKNRRVTVEVVGHPYNLNSRIIDVKR